MIVVSDTSPVTALLQVGRCELLEQLFGDVLIPPAVHTELLRFHEALPKFLRIQELSAHASAGAVAPDLDRGESEAIALAQELRADYLLIDERRGRSIAMERGVRVIGLLGVLLVGRKEGLINSVRNLMDALETRAGFLFQAPYGS